MKRKVTYTYALTRNEVIAAIVAAVNLPKGTVHESFSMEASALAEPAPVLWMSVEEESETPSREARP